MEDAPGRRKRGTAAGARARRRSLAPAWPAGRHSSAPPCRVRYRIHQEPSIRLIPRGEDGDDQKLPAGWPLLFSRAARLLLNHPFWRPMSP
ncbi:hypothetical protein PAHAL_8G023700 [Panicum hallii]|uniref:Uncharacterized protein n=1 Tax=Panicum hallii TaxID=206008 RepID=A0A2T8I7B9_9POAL|nr:hypothetical protein PAHAL_8G023700 [Panicum hallii]